MSKQRLVWAFGALGGIVLAAPAPAQGGPEAALEEITVTARKTSESLVDVPVAITALSGEDLAERGINDLFDLASFTPGFRFQNQAVGRNDRGFTQYVIRGMVPNSAIATRQSVTIFVDGAPVTGGSVSGITDIERVEVVKGPQSAFFGKSTFAGAVNYITRAPGYDWGGNVDLSYESYDTLDLKGSFEGPIIADKLAFRVSARSYQTDGQFRDSVFTGERLGARDTKSVSLSLLAEPTDSLRLRLFGVKWQDDDGLPANSRYGLAELNCATVTAVAGRPNYTCGSLGDMPAFHRSWNPKIEPAALTAIQTTGQRLFSPGFIDHLGLYREAEQYRMLGDWEFGGGYTLSGIVAYSKNQWSFLQTGLGQDTRAIPNNSATATNGRIPYVYALIRGDNENIDKYAELRLSSPQDERFRWLIGANYLNSRTAVATLSFQLAGFLQNTPENRYKSDAQAVFGSVGWDFTDKFSVSVEGRYQKNEEGQRTLAGTFPVYEETTNAFTPRVILQYKPSEVSSAYVSYSEGTRPAEFNGTFFASSPFVQQQILATAAIQGVVPEDKIWMAEVGYKGQLLDNRLRILAAAYYGKWTDRHVQNSVQVYATPAAQAAGVLSNLSLVGANGEVDLQGLEVEAAFAATPSLTLEAGFSLAQTDTVRTSCSDCVALERNINPTGRVLPYYPEISGFLSGTWEFPLFSKDAYLRADVLYTGKQYETESNLAYSAPSSVVNLRIGADFGRFRAEIFGTNIFDETAPSSLARVLYSEYSPTGVPSSVNGITVSPADKPSFGLRVSAKF